MKQIPQFFINTWNRISLDSQRNQPREKPMKKASIIVCKESCEASFINTSITELSNSKRQSLADNQNQYRLSEIKLNDIKETGQDKNPENSNRHQLPRKSISSPQMLSPTLKTTDLAKTSANKLSIIEDCSIRPNPGSSCNFDRNLTNSPMPLEIEFDQQLQSSTPLPPSNQKDNAVDNNLDQEKMQQLSNNINSLKEKNLNNIKLIKTSISMKQQDNSYLKENYAHKKAKIKKNMSMFNNAEDRYISYNEVSSIDSFTGKDIFYETYQKRFVDDENCLTTPIRDEDQNQEQSSNTKMGELPVVTLDDCKERIKMMKKDKVCYKLRAFKG